MIYIYNILNEKLTTIKTIYIYIINKTKHFLTTSIIKRKIYQIYDSNMTKLALYTRIWVNKAFFTPFYLYFELKYFFLAKLLMPYLKLYNRLVSYQKSEKSNDWLPRNARKCIFFTPISPFLAKKIFFSKIRLHQSLGAVKSYLDTKNQKILMSRSSGISRTN